MKSVFIKDLKLQNNQCPFCNDQLLINGGVKNCYKDSCKYFSIQNRYCYFVRGRYGITYYYNIFEVVIELWSCDDSVVEQRVSGTSTDFINLDWGSPDLEDQLDLILFYR